jgi:hypothetical protein
LLDGEAQVLTAMSVELALEGDRTAWRMCLDRIGLPRRERIEGAKADWGDWAFPASARRNRVHSAARAARPADGLHVPEKYLKKYLKNI